MPGRRWGSFPCCVRLCNRWPAGRLSKAFIYGSVARQTDTAGSDVDLLLVGENLSLNEILNLLLPLEAQLGRKINPNCYAPAEYAKRVAEPDSFVNRVLAQVTLPLIGTWMPQPALDNLVRIG